MWVRSLGFLLPRGKGGERGQEGRVQGWDVLAALGGGTPLLLGGGLPGGKGEGGG